MPNKENQQPQFNNAAGRLASLLSELATIHGWTTAQVWREMFAPWPESEDGARNVGREMTEADIYSIHNGLAELRESVQDIEDAIREGEAHPEVYLQHFDRLKRFLSPLNLDANFDEYRKLVTPELITSVTFCAKDIPLDGEITPEDIKTLLNSTTELQSLVKESKLPPTLKKWLLRLLFKIEDALRHYDRFGSKGLRKALANMLGELLIDGEKTKIVDKDTNIRSKLSTLLGQLKTFCEAAEHVKTLYEITRHGVVLYLAYQSGTYIEPPPSSE